MATKMVSINRVPILTLWASIVAEHLGFDEDASLTLGRAVAALNAQSKGRRLSILKPDQKKIEKPLPERVAKTAFVQVGGRAVPAHNTRQGLRAIHGRKPIRPDTVRNYLEGALGPDLDPVSSALQKLATSYDPEDLDRKAYSLYEQFRPVVPSGVRGWGAKGKLDWGIIRQTTRPRIQAHREKRQARSP